MNLMSQLDDSDDESPLPYEGTFRRVPSCPTISCHDCDLRGACLIFLNDLPVLFCLHRVLVTVTLTSPLSRIHTAPCCDAAAAQPQPRAAAAAPSLSFKSGLSTMPYVSIIMADKYLPCVWAQRKDKVCVLPALPLFSSFVLKRCPQLRYR